MRNMLDPGEEAIFKPDLNRSMLGAKIALLDWLGFEQLLEHREFSNEDSAMLDIAQKAKAHPFEMIVGLGVSVSEKDLPMAIGQRLVGPFQSVVGSQRCKAPRSSPVVTRLHLRG